MLRTWNRAWAVITNWSGEGSSVFPTSPLGPINPLDHVTRPTDPRALEASYRI